VGDRNKITIKHMIAICAKHAHVKNVKKGKYELDANDSVRIENKNLEDACVIFQLSGMRLNPGAKLEEIVEPLPLIKTSILAC
jgi:hypothetical protein